MGAVITAQGRSVRARRALLFFLAVSATLHAAVVALLPGRAPEHAAPAASSLEVVILQPMPLPQDSISPAPRRAQAATGMKARSERATLEQYSRPAEEVLPSPAVVDDPEPRFSVPERPSQAAATPANPPVYHAAYLSNPAPRYPDAARKSGDQGTVTLRVQVTRDGVASRVAVEKSSGSPHLDTAALEAVKAWRFTPARRGGDAVESWMLVPVVFSREGSS
jgi:protein TonB